MASLAATRATKSTNVRPALMAARMAARTLQAMSPTLAGEAAARMFVTTWRRDRPARERELLARGERFAVTVGGADLAAWRFGDGPAVLLAHGWNGRGAQLGALIDPLVASGRRVVLFDAPGHGDSPGHSATMLDFADAIERVAASVGGVSAIVAHSLGGSATAVALGRRLEAARVVLVGTPVAPSSWVEELARALELSHEARSAMVRGIESRAGAPLDSVDVLRIARSLSTPLLVVHDRGDREVPFAAGRALAETWPGAELLATDGLGHQRILRDAGVVRAIVDFVQHPTEGGRHD